MNKTMMIAAALLTMGATSAFAGEDFPGRYAAPATSTTVSAPAAGQHRIFAASSRPTTSVYSLFSTPGNPQGGEQ